jgi:hypothetical protein
MSKAGAGGIEGTDGVTVNRARPDKLAALKNAQRESVKREAQLANAAYMALAKFRVNSAL